MLFNDIKVALAAENIAYINCKGVNLVWQARMFGDICNM
jgi:hypothetical protein